MLAKDSISAVEAKAEGGRRLQKGFAYDEAAGPLVTVITAVFNGANTIRGCIESVLCQDYPNMEHIIIDAGSTDGTIDILREYEDRLALWTSESDRGVYDAWNKGVNLAQGQWISFLGADDEYLPGAILAYIAIARDTPDIDYMSSKVKWLHSSGYSKIIGGPWEWPQFSRFMCSAHVGSLHRKQLFEQYGLFDTSYRITADYEFLLRPRAKLRAAFVPVVTVLMRAGGLSDSTAALREANRAKLETGGLSKFKAFFDLSLAIIKYNGRNIVHPVLGRFR